MSNSGRPLRRKHLRRRSARPRDRASSDRRQSDPSAMRRAIASTMSRSKREIPHYYLAHTIDLEPALTWLERRNAQRPIERRLVHGVLLWKACRRARQRGFVAERILAR